MDKALLIQLLGSAVAVSLLVAIAAWARIPRATPPLDAESAKAVATNAPARSARFENVAQAARGTRASANGDSCRMFSFRWAMA